MTASAQKVPLLVVVFNNRQWKSVRDSVSEVAPDGWAISRNDYALIDLLPSPNFEKVAESCGAYGEQVEDPGVVPAAIRRGLTQIRENGIHALLNVICG